MTNPKYVVTAGDCTSDDYAEALYPDAKLISLRLADNGAAAFEKFKELGSEAVMIASTTPLHFSDNAKSVLDSYKIKKYFGRLNYTLMSKDPTIKYGTSFEGKSLGGISPLVGKIAAKLVNAAKYVRFTDPDVSTRAAINGEIDLVSKPSREGVFDTEGGLHLVCDLTKEFGIELKYYLVAHDGDHDADALATFKSERASLAKYADIV